jgi:hypothetical protein
MIFVSFVLGFGVSWVFAWNPVFTRASHRGEPVYTIGTQRNIFVGDFSAGPADLDP